MIIRTQAHPRAGLIGNPSDGYFGKTISLALSNFRADVVLYEAPELEILPSQDNQITLQDKNFTIRYHSNIPHDVDLADSSAKFTGPGSVIIGTDQDERMFNELRKRLRKLSIKIIKPRIVGGEGRSRS